MLHRRGDTQWEIHCHGGKASMGAILSLLEQHGCEPLDWRQYLNRTCRNGIRREALTALAACSTQRAAGILLDQLHGALANSIKDLIASLQRDAAAPRGIIANKLDALLRRASIGLHLVDPWRVAIVGRPNVGKSCLMNALSGYERAVTSAHAGTTRDLVETTVSLHGWAATLIDTAGWRESSDDLERTGIVRAQEMLETADLRMVVLDQSMPLQREDRALLARWPDAVVVANKIDLPACTDTQLRDNASPVSAQKGDGLELLIEKIVRRLVPEEPAPDTAVPFTARQCGHLRRARSAAQNNQWQTVEVELRHLSEENH